MATFSQWLAKQEDAPQDSPVGWLARAWKSQEGNRPRVSSPSGIEKHMLTLAAGDDAQQDSWRSYVHTAVNEATTAYKADKVHEQPAGGKNTSSQETLPGMNEQTGKPVAVVMGSQWQTYPDASQYGSCATCGWPRGLADRGPAADQETRIVITCAAGHVFEPQKPGPADAGPAAATSPEATAALAAGEQPVSGMTDEQLLGQVAEQDPDAQMSYTLPEDDSGPVDLLALVNLKLTVVMVSLGLPTDPGEMGDFLLASISGQQAGSLSDQLAQGLAEAGVNEHPDTGKGGWRAGADANGQLPPDFAAWYGIADPDASEQ
jgi:hypothetical protein